MILDVGSLNVYERFCMYNLEMFLKGLVWRISYKGSWNVPTARNIHIIFQEQVVNERGTKWGNLTLWGKIKPPWGFNVPWQGLRHVTPVQRKHAKRLRMGFWDWHMAPYGVLTTVHRLYPNCHKIFFLFQNNLKYFEIVCLFFSSSIK